MRPRSSRWLVRAALLHLLAGSALGLWILASRAGLAPEPPAATRDAHAEMLLAGWIVQLAAGVAFWILPRPPRAGPRRSATPGWAVLALLNAGVALAAGAALVPLPAACLPAGRAAQLAAVCVLASHVAGRLARRG